MTDGQVEPAPAGNMFARERVERLLAMQAKGKAQIRAKHGRDLTIEELEALIR